MAYLDNMETVKNAFPDIWQSMTDIQERLDSGLVQTITNKKGISNLKVDQQFIHGQPDPLKDARDFIGQFQNVADHSDVLFYGLGLGYQIEAFVETYPDTPFSIYEPVPEVFYQFLCHQDFSRLPLRNIKNLYLESRPEDMEMYTANIVSGIRSSILIIELPAYQQLFPLPREAFFTRFGSLIEDRRHSLGTLAAFQKRWTINSVKNFMRVLTTPDIVLQQQAQFGGQPALLVASGPTLADEIEDLRIIKEKGLAYIFSVGTAVNTLVQHGVYPDGTCTYDPSEENQIVFQDIKAKGLDSIPLIFGSTVGYETLENYPGSQLHMLLSQDALAAFYLQPEKQGQLEFIADGSTIAVIALQLLYKLGFSPIILVGLNLAFHEGMQYAAGSTFFPLEASQADLARPLMVCDVYGNETASSYSLNGMRRQLEAYLRHYSDVEVINTTRHGAHIEGSYFKPLRELIDERLQEKQVKENWLPEPAGCYDLKHLMGQHLRMTEAFAKLERLMGQCRTHLELIQQTTESRDARVISSGYDQFNLSMASLRENLFFHTLIEPMNRLELQFLMLAVPDISREQNAAVKARMMQEEFGAFLDGCEKDIRLIGPLFQELHNDLKQYYQDYMIHRKSAQIKMLLIDGAAVLTDGTVFYSAMGDEFRKFSRKDRCGVASLQFQGIECLLVNPEDDPILSIAAAKMGIKQVLPGTADQILNGLAEQYQPEELAWVGSEAMDPGCFASFGLRFLVKDGMPACRDQVDYVLKSGGGEGAIWEIANLQLRVKQDFVRNMVRR